MATPGDALRAQAEVRLQQLRRKVAAHRKVKDYEGEEKALKELDALEAVMKYIDETSDEMIPVRVICSELEVAVHYGGRGPVGQVIEERSRRPRDTD